VLFACGAGEVRPSRCIGIKCGTSQTIAVVCIMADQSSPYNAHAPVLANSYVWYQSSTSKEVFAAQPSALEASEFQLVEAEVV
jgi:hypothetical protein